MIGPIGVCLGANSNASYGNQYPKSREQAKGETFEDILKRFTEASK